MIITTPNKILFKIFLACTSICIASVLVAWAVDFERDEMPLLYSSFLLFGFVGIITLLIMCLKPSDKVENSNQEMSSIPGVDMSQVIPSYPCIVKENSSIKFKPPEYMTDTANALLVVLEKDTKTDDVESLVNAIKHMKGVVDVQLNISDPSDHIAQARAKQDLARKIYDVLI